MTPDTAFKAYRCPWCRTTHLRTEPFPEPPEPCQHDGLWIIAMASWAIGVAVGVTIALVTT